MLSQLVGTMLIGFDSAWADRKHAPGAICALAINASGVACFDRPSLINFEVAANFIEARHTVERLTLVAIDQPIIVRNATGMRPCEKVVASVARRSGGGIQPANREGPGKAAMFGDHAPIWSFLKRLDFVNDPPSARSSARGGYVMEVYPALALLDLDPAFAARQGPVRATTRPGERPSG